VIRPLAASAAAAMLLAACGSSGGHPDSAAGPSGDAATVASAVCAKDAAAKKVALPGGFPSDFPLPPGTVVYSVDDRGDAGIVVTGVTSTPFPDVLKAMQSRLPAAGFRAEDGESEPHDAESDWASSDFRGRWAIREIPQCSGDTLVNVVARKRA
jgi:hypothetical protein